jgi:hypothetical protein
VPKVPRPPAEPRHGHDGSAMPKRTHVGFNSDHRMTNRLWERVEAAVGLLREVLTVPLPIGDRSTMLSR